MGPGSEAGTTNEYALPFSRHGFVRGLPFRSPPKSKRAQGRPGARCTRGLVCNVHHKKCAHEHTGSAETLRPSLRNGFTAYIVLSPVTGFLATVASVMRSIIADLTPASGRQDHTTSPYAKAPFVHAHKARDDAAASTASHPAFRDDHDTPLLSGQDGEHMPVIWVRSQVNFRKSENRSGLKHQTI